MLVLGKILSIGSYWGCLGHRRILLTAIDKFLRKFWEFLENSPVEYDKVQGISHSLTFSLFKGITVIISEWPQICSKVQEENHKIIPKYYQKVQSTSRLSIKFQMHASTTKVHDQSDHKFHSIHLQHKNCSSRKITKSRSFVGHTIITITMYSIRMDVNWGWLDMNCVLVVVWMTQK